MRRSTNQESNVTPLRLSIGGIPVDGEYRYERLAARPYQFKITVSQVSGEALEKLLMPTLHRGTFLNYAFNFGRVPEPDWMRNMHADGTVQVSTLSLGNRAFTKLKTRVLWDGDTVRFTGIHTQLGAALFNGDAAIDLADRQPGYQVNGRLSGLVWRSGTIDAEGTLTTSGTGAELLSNISAQGELKGKDVNTWRTLDGCFDLSPNKLRVTDLVIGSRGEMYVGTAESQQNGRVAVKASDGTKKIETTLDPLF